MIKFRDYITNTFRKIISWKDENLFKVLIDNSKYLLSGSIIATLFGFARTALTTRALGLELFGILAIIISYVEVMVGATKFSPWHALIKFGSEAFNDDQKSTFMGYVKQSLIFDGISALLGFFVANAFIDVFSNYFSLSSDMRSYIALYSLVAFLDFSGTPIGVLRLLNKFRYFMVQNFIIATLGVVGAAVAYFTGGGILEFIFVIISSKLIGTIYIVIIMIYELRKNALLEYWRSPIKNWREFAKFTFWKHLTLIISIPAKHLDVIIVSAVVTIEAAGIYKIIKQVAGTIGLLIDPIYYAIFPQFADLIAKEKRSKAYKFGIKSGIVSFLLVGSIGLIIGGLSPWWLGLVFGEQFSSGWIPLIAFLLVKVFEFSFNPIHPLFVALGHVKYESAFFILSSGIFLLLSWFLGNLYGLIGIILANGLGVLVLVLSKLIFIFKNDNENIRLAIKG
jgi:O-antigen/teichoic acid export membrane protein